MSILQQERNRGVRKDRENVEPKMGALLSQAEANIVLISRMYRYLYKQYSVSDPNVPQAFIDKLTPKIDSWQQQINSIRNKIRRLDDLFGADQAARDAAESSLDTEFNNETFEDRYDV